jgi:hypothetical protein
MLKYSYRQIFLSYQIKTFQLILSHFRWLSYVTFPQGRGRTRTRNNQGLTTPGQGLFHPLSCPCPWPGPNQDLPHLPGMEEEIRILAPTTEPNKAKLLKTAALGMCPEWRFTANLRENEMASVPTLVFRAQCYKTWFINVRNKLECLSLAGMFSLVLCFRYGQEPTLMWIHWKGL